jgi:alkylated DNA repair dioxygenase AlkB
MTSIRHGARVHLEQGELFDAAARLPEGLEYRPGFLSTAEEAGLLAQIARLPLHEALYKSYVARRRIASFGSQYDFDAGALGAAPDMPAFLAPLRDKAAAWLGLPAADLAHALLTEYRPGTALGWHRDVPDFELVTGISLGAACRMRFRPYPPDKAHRSEAFELDLEPRSAYVLRGAVRWGWQHSIPPTAGLRHSVTFRTLRRNPGRSPRTPRRPD